MSTLAGMNSPPQVFTVAEHGYMQFSKKLRVASDGKRMCFYVDRELHDGTYLLTNCAGRALAYATCTTHASCTRHGAIAGSGVQLNPLDFPVYVETSATLQAGAESTLFLLQHAAPFQGEYRLVGTPIKKGRSEVGKVWFSYCVENFGTARSVEITPTKRGKKK